MKLNLNVSNKYVTPDFCISRIKFIHDHFMKDKQKLEYDNSNKMILILLKLEIFPQMAKSS